MNTVQLLRAWLGAGMLLAAAMLAGWLKSDHAGPRFHQAPVAVIGTSLLANGVAENGSGPASIMPDGRNHWRIAIALGRESDMISLLRSALAERAQVVVIEVNPLISSFAFVRQQRDCDVAGAGLRAQLKAWQIAVTDMVRPLIGSRTSLEGIGEPVMTNGPQVIEPDVLRQLYPLSVHAPCDEAELADLAAQARAQGARIVLVMPPRSKLAEARVGADRTRALLAEARGLSTRLGVPLVELSGPWDNAEFMDHAHLSLAGRAHFTRALRGALAGMAL